MILVDIDGVSAHVNTKNLLGCGFCPNVPYEHCFVPSSTEKHVWVEGVPFQAKHSVFVRSHVSDFQISWVSF
jgi:hypothetical protein